MFGNGPIGRRAITLRNCLGYLAIAFRVTLALLFGLPRLDLGTKEVRARQGHHPGKFRIAAKLYHNVVEAPPLVQIIPPITRNMEIAKACGGIQQSPACAFTAAILGGKPGAQSGKWLQRIQQVKHRLPVKRCDIRTTEPAERHDPRSSKMFERLPQGAATNTQTRCQFRFEQMLARHQSATANIQQDNLGNSVARADPIAFRLRIGSDIRFLGALAFQHLCHLFPQLAQPLFGADPAPATIAHSIA